MRAGVKTIDRAAMLQTALWLFALVSVLAIGAAILERIRRFMRETEDAPVDLLATLQDAFDDGEIDEDEFRRAREILDRKADQAANGQEPRVPEF